jgi:uncharacterized protein YgiM (DUF1202 family)
MNYQQMFYHQPPSPNHQNDVNKETDVNTTLTSEKIKVNIIHGMVINCYRLNVREMPSKTSKILCVIDSGTVVMVEPIYNTTNIDDTWVHIRVNDIVGYVKGQYLKEVK